MPNKIDKFCLTLVGKHKTSHIQPARLQTASTEKCPYQSMKDFAVLNA